LIPVREVIDIVKRVSQKDFKIAEAGRRAGDPAVLISSSEKAMELLNWRPQYGDIEAIVKTAWKWHQKASAFSAKQTR
jgi:UDP-glucose 4-epimerase